MERLAGESARAYHLFRLYCELGVNRSLAQVQQAYVKETGHGISLRTLKRLSSRFRWLERAHLYDQQQRLARERERQQLREAMMEHTLAILQALASHLRQACSQLPEQLSVSEFVKLIEAFKALMDLLPTTATQPSSLLHGEWDLQRLIELEAQQYGVRVG